MYSETDGEIAVRLARWSIEAHLRQEESQGPSIPASFSEKSGTFVTLNTYPQGELRGCIGYPEPSLPLRDAIAHAAVMACHDPRFPPLELEELNRVVVEVSLLTPPELVEVSKPIEYKKVIVVGRDGLIVRYGGLSGLLLPQVPVDWDWKPEEFLSHTCIKAGLPPDAWLEAGVRVYRFQAEIFEEEEPGGKVHRRGLSAAHDGHRG